MKHLGILAHSAEGSALCYLAACHEGSRQLGPHLHPDITTSVIAMGHSMPAWERHALQPIRATLAVTVQRLLAAGCDFFVCPDNTAHLALQAQGPALALPGLHIADVVAKAARDADHRTLGVLGTRWTMEGPLYREALARQGLACRSPAHEDRAFVHRLIFEELCNGVLRDASRAECQRVIARLAESGCDAVVLGCTEIPLLIGPGDSPLPTLDSTRLLAARGVAVALGKAPFPSWRGGPVH
ncbi:aspartate/glutamate racemase family protein [Variovorax sp. 160MFSha2.1]|uniref:aspartate/glutamate racemase family protein n=1 Tax=Variovorax sp. 160MFSha2.1 TaxID=3158367 RepID=UPI003AAD6D11